MMVRSIDLEAGDHVTTTGLDVQVIASRHLTDDTASGVSFRLLPSGNKVDASEVTAVTGYSHREYVRDEEEE